MKQDQRAIDRRAYMTPKEAAEYLVLTPRAVRGYFQRGLITGKRLTVRGHIMLSRESVIRFGRGI